MSSTLNINSETAPPTNGEAPPELSVSQALTRMVYLAALHVMGKDGEYVCGLKIGKTTGAEERFYWNKPWGEDGPSVKWRIFDGWCCVNTSDHLLTSLEAHFLYEIVETGEWKSMFDHLLTSC